MRECRPFIDGRWRETGDIVEVTMPGSATRVARVHRAGPDQVEEAIVAAQRVFARTRSMPAWQRHGILTKMAAGIARRRDALASMLVEEAGKPIKAARVEVDRAGFTFEVAAEEARRLGGELFGMDWAAWGADRIGIVRRFPIGPVAAITPFNFPLNLCAHKMAPCIAAGSAMVLKPASQTPSAALALAEIAHEAGLPPGAINVLPATAEAAGPLITDDRFKLLTFTGSAAVGWELKRRAGRKKVALELGGNAAAIVHADADLAHAAERIVAGGYAYSGQSCISVQRVLVHRDAHGRFMERLVPMVEALKVGDPREEATDIGPLITEQDAGRALSWIEEAVAGGARLVLGGRRDGAWLAPTLLDAVQPDMKVSCREVFAPVVAVSTFETLDEALDRVNESDFGLQAGLFTRDAPSIWRAFERLEVGGLMVDEAPTFRMDHMPYGGVKDSGLGREGLRYAIEEMTEIKVMGWRIR